MATVPYNSEMVYNRAKGLALEAKRKFNNEPYMFAPDRDQQDKANYFYEIGKVAEACMYVGSRINLTFDELKNLGFILPEDDDGF